MVKEKTKSLLANLLEQSIYQMPLHTLIQRDINAGADEWDIEVSKPSENLMTIKSVLNTNSKTLRLQARYPTVYNAYFKSLRQL